MLSDKLRRQCIKDPGEDFHVVVTLKATSAHLTGVDLELTDMVPIMGSDGLLKGRLTGGELLMLAHRAEVEAIDPDIEAMMLDGRNLAWASTE